MHNLIDELQGALELWNGEPLYDKCIRNCHAKGIYSIVLNQGVGGRLLRMYLALEGNELYKNDPSNEHPMLVGFHNHRYSLALKVIAGKLFNHLVYEVEEGMPYNSYVYTTGIDKDRSAEFVFKEKTELSELSKIEANQGDCFVLKAKDLHSISTLRGELVAWVIMEGEPDPNYESKLITNVKLEEVSFRGLYQKPTKEEVDMVLERFKNEFKNRII